jgi:uncharacterized membrane protein YuzA (DUF378 family)
MILDRIALALAIIGGLNWGSIGIFGFDLVSRLFGGTNVGALNGASRVVYTIFGIASIWCISLLFRERHYTEPDRA